MLYFNGELAQMIAQFFVKKLLINSYNVRCLVLGNDFHFGKVETRRSCFIV
ncbi:MAG: hypothetical protein HRT91_03705 [Piscirickettsiaceae bacterium]|nr:hypothetical protein [Piscirickettsiaceae bacterium]